MSISAKGNLGELLESKQINNTWFVYAAPSVEALFENLGNALEKRINQMREEGTLGGGGDIEDLKVYVQCLEDLVLGESSSAAAFGRRRRRRG